MFKKKFALFLLTVFLLISFTPIRSAAEGSQEIKRLWGKTRYETAVSISQNGWTESNSVILASGANFPDALTGVTLSYEFQALILLTGKDTINTDVLNEIKRLQAKDIYILGGIGVISSQLEQDLKDQGYITHRLAGTNRAATAAAVGNELRKYEEVSTVFLTTGADYPDALSAGPAAAVTGAPILFTDKNTLSAETKTAIKNWNIGKVIIAGGTGVVSQNVENEIESMGKTVERIAGKDRYETSLKIGSAFSSKLCSYYVTIATGINFPDALAGGALSARRGAVLLLSDPASLSTGLKNFITSHMYRSLYVYGGTGAISDSLMTSISKYLRPDLYEKPSAPENLTVKVTNIDDAELTWNPVSAADKYKIYRNDQFIAETTDNTYIDTTEFVSNINYTYYVTAVNYYGEGSPSNSAVFTSVTEKADTPQNLSASVTAENKVRLTWNNNFWQVLSFDIYRDGVYLATTDNEYYEDTSAAFNTTYRYKVTGYNAYYSKSDFTPEVSITTN